jgi:hypothetical protein
MSENGKLGLYKIFDILAKILAIVVLLAFIFQNIVGLGWLDSLLGENLAEVAKYAVLITSYSGLALAILVALEFGTKHNFIIFLIVLVIVALVVIPIFFTDLWSKIVEMVGTMIKIT